MALQQLVTDKIKTFDIDLDYNPLSKAAFHALPIDVKVSKRVFVCFFQFRVTQIYFLRSYTCYIP